MAGRNDTKLIQELKRKEQDLLSLASIEVGPSIYVKPAPVSRPGHEDLGLQDRSLGFK